MLKLKHLLCLVILFLVSSLYGMEQSKNGKNLEVDFRNDEEGILLGYSLLSSANQKRIFLYRESVKAILKQRYDDVVDKDKEAYRCHKCVFVFPQEKIFWMNHEHLCYECLYRFVPIANIPSGLQFRYEEFDVDITEEFDVDISQMLQNEIPFKDSSIMPQILGHGFLCATASLIYYDDLQRKLEDEENKSIPHIIQLLQPIFFGYIYITSNIFAYHMYGSRIKHREIPFSLFPCMKEEMLFGEMHFGSKVNSKHLDTGYPGFQLLFSILVFMLYLTNHVDIANWLLEIFMFWSAFSLWYWRKSGFNYFDRYFSIFHEMQPQKWASIACGEKPDQTIMRMAFLEEKNSFRKSIKFVSKQLLIFFNVVSSSILFDMLCNESKNTKIYTILFDISIIKCEVGLNVITLFGANMGVWYAVIVVSIVNMIKNKQQPPLMTFNGLLRFIFVGLYAAEITFDNRFDSGIIRLILIMLFCLCIFF